jgi:hypothetical protein
VVAIVLGVAALLLIWTSREAGWPDKALISASYFISFQYTVLARSYGLGLVILLLVVTRHAWLRSRPLLAGALIGAAALVHIYFAILAPALAAYLLYRWRLPLRSAATMGAIVLALTAVALTLAFLSMPAEAPAGRVADLAASDFTPGRAVALFGAAFAPRLGLAVQLGTLALLAVAFWRAWPEAVAFAAGAGAVGLVQLGLYGGAIHHVGVIAVFFVVLYMARPRAFVRPTALAVLAIGAFAGVQQAVRDVSLPYSASLQAAEMIRGAGLAAAPIVFYPDFTGTAVAAALHRRAYSLECECMFDFARWRERDRGLEPDALATRLARYLNDAGTPAVYALVSLGKGQKLLAALP